MSGKQQAFGRLNRMLKKPFCELGDDKPEAYPTQPINDLGASWGKPPGLPRAFSTSFWYMKRSSAALCVFAATAALLPACGRAHIGNLETESSSVELGSAEVVRTRIEMKAGELRINGGAKRLLEADFRYNVARSKPEVN